MLTNSVYAACPAPNTPLIANGTTVNETGCIIAPFSTVDAVQASNAANVTLTNSTITATGATGDRATATGANTTINLNGTSITAEGLGVSTTNLLTGNIFINFNKGTVTTTGSNSLGFAIRGGGIATITNSLLFTQFTSATAISTQTGGSVLMQNSSISGPGRAIDGAANSTTVVEESIITNNNAASSANIVIAAGTNALITLNRTSITTAGANAITASVGRINLNDSTVTTSGSNAKGITVGVNGIVNLTNSVVTTIGNLAYPLATSTTLSNGNGTINATNTVLNSNSPSIGAINVGTLNINLTNVTNHSTANQLAQVNSARTLNLAANQSTLNGNVTVLGTGTGNFTLLDQTTWTGAATNLTNLNLNASTWNLNANSTIKNQVTNAGLISFVPQGNTFKTLTVTGPYVGQGGILSLNTFLGRDGSPSDQLVINGNSATGNTLLTITNTNGPGAPTTGNGIEVINAINGGTTAPGAFSLANLVIAGPFQYNLFRGTVDASDPNSWFLRSTVRSEVSLYSALPSAVLLYGRTLLDSLHQRIRDEFQTCSCEEQCCDQYAFLKRFWSRGIFRNGRWEGEEPSFRYNVSAYQAGIDVIQRIGANGSRDHLGVLGAVGYGKSRVRDFDNERAGTNKFDAYTAGAYWTRFSPCRWYLDGVFQTTWYRNMKAHSRLAESLKTHGIEYLGSIEAGYAWLLRCFTLEPQAQIVYQNLSLHNSHDIASTVNFDRTQSTLGRLGVRLINTYNIKCRPVTAWVRADVWHDFNGKSKTFFPTIDGPIGFSSDIGGSWFEGTVGLTAQLTDILDLYGSFTGSTYFEHHHSYFYNGIVGLRANF